jgi:predicted deacylase
MALFYWPKAWKARTSTHQAVLGRGIARGWSRCHGKPSSRVASCAALYRVFPGRLGGGVTELIAHAVAERLLPECDVLVDLHSGGRSLLYTPLAATHLLDEPERDRRALAALRAFGAP